MRTTNMSIIIEIFGPRRHSIKKMRVTYSSLAVVGILDAVPPPGLLMISHDFGIASLPGSSTCRCTYLEVTPVVELEKPLQRKIWTSSRVFESAKNLLKLYMAIQS